MTDTIARDRIAEWIDWLRIALAPLTVKAYEWELRKLELFFIDRCVLDLTAADLAHYIAHRRVTRQCSETTVRRTSIALKAFYKFSLKSKSPARNLPVPTAKKKKQRTLTFAQSFELMLACDTSTVRGKRDLALVCLLLDSGLRESEACRLIIADVDMEHRLLTVQVKGGNDGDGIFSKDTQAALAAWLAVRPLYALHGVDNFFVSVGGTKPGSPITPSGLRVIFRRLGKLAGFEHLSPHDLRRSFATQSTKLGAPARVLQVAGRWKDIQMVVGYTPTIEAEDFDPYSPVAHALKGPIVEP